jgi:hypothetical protein
MAMCCEFDCGRGPAKHSGLPFIFVNFPKIPVSAYSGQKDRTVLNKEGNKMGNWSEYRLDVFASSEVEINQIATRLQSPSQGLVEWAAEKLGLEGAEAIARVSKLCNFKPEKDLKPRPVSVADLMEQLFVKS